jgi:Protein of unknown function (DUF4246)
VQADELIPDDLLAELKNGVAKLEDVPASKKDWHPDSDDQVHHVFPLLFLLSSLISFTITF